MLARPAAVQAIVPRLVSEFTVRNITTNSDWADSVEAKKDDVLKYRLTITCTDSIAEAKDVKVLVRLPNLATRLSLNTASYVTALNAVARDVVATSALQDNGMFALEYVPGTASISKAGGSYVSISPDTATDNLTTTTIRIGNILSGEANRSVIEFDAKVVLQESNKTGTGGGGVITTPTPTPTGTATNSAVAKTTPKTGFTDPIWVNTFGWLALGVAGGGLKVAAGKISKKTQQITV